MPLRISDFGFRIDDSRAVANVAGFTVDRKQIVMDRVLKTLGLHEVRIRLHAEVSINVIVNIARSDEEAEIQSRGESVADVAERALDNRAEETGAADEEITGTNPESEEDE